MAVDTRDKRASSLSIGLLLALPLANADIDQGDRQHTIASYRGILASEPIEVIRQSFAVCVTLNDEGQGVELGLDASFATCTDLNSIGLGVSTNIMSSFAVELELNSDGQSVEISMNSSKGVE